MSITRLTIAVAAAAGALALPAVAFSEATTPDARDAALGAGIYAGQSATLVIPSPDARDASRGVGLYLGPVVLSRADARSPDAMDAARGVMVGWGTTYAPAAAPASDGFGWTDALIGAAVMLGLIAIAAGLSVLVTHHGPRHTPIPH